MARGGRRVSRGGGKYPNRTDLQGAQLPVDAPRGLPYGDRAKLVAAQRQVPMGQAPMPSAPPGMGGAGPIAGSPPAPVPPPGQMTPGGFTGPTQRPNEPVTAGLPMGPGPGPEVLSANQARPGDPLFQAIAALDALGDTADAATKGLRDTLHATVANRSVP